MKGGRISHPHQKVWAAKINTRREPPLALQALLERIIVRIYSFKRTVLHMIHLIRARSDF